MEGPLPSVDGHHPQDRGHEWNSQVRKEGWICPSSAWLCEQEQSSSSALHTSGSQAFTLTLLTLESSPLLAGLPTPPTILGLQRADS
jgi:hypothetical protein